MATNLNHDYRPKCRCSLIDGVYFFDDYPVSPYFPNSKVSKGWINLVTVNHQHLRRHYHHERHHHHYRPEPVIQYNNRANCMQRATLSDYLPCVRTKRRKSGRRDFRSKRNSTGKGDRRDLKRKENNLSNKSSTPEDLISATGKTIHEPAIQWHLFTNVLKRTLENEETKAKLQSIGRVYRKRYFSRKGNKLNKKRGNKIDFSRKGNVDSLEIVTLKEVNKRKFLNSRKKKRKLKRPRNVQRRVLKDNPIKVASFKIAAKKGWNHRKVMKSKKIKDRLNFMRKVQQRDMKNNPKMVAFLKTASKKKPKERKVRDMKNDAEELSKPEEQKVRDRKNDAEKLSNNVILAGTSVTPFSPTEDTSEIAREIIWDCCWIKVPMYNITHAYRLGKAPIGGLPDKRNIKVFLSNTKTKIDIIKALIALRNTTASGLYINEQLLPSVAELYYYLRKLRKENRDKIGTLHTMNGIIKVRKTKEKKVYEIFTVEDFEQFLEVVNLPNPLKIIKRNLTSKLKPYYQVRPTFW